MNKCMLATGSSLRTRTTKMLIEFAFFVQMLLFVLLELMYQQRPWDIIQNMQLPQYLIICMRKVECSKSGISCLHDARNPKCVYVKYKRIYSCKSAIFFFTSHWNSLLKTYNCAQTTSKRCQSSQMHDDPRGNAIMVSRRQTLANASDWKLSNLFYMRCYY